MHMFLVWLSSEHVYLSGVFNWASNLSGVVYWAQVFEGLSIGHVFFILLVYWTYLSGVVNLACVFEWSCLLGTCI